MKTVTLLMQICLTIVISPWVFLFAWGVSSLLIPSPPWMIVLIAVLSLLGTWGVVREKFQEAKAES